ncbi:hypothetical protein [Georgenia daeguensis]|uniref:Capsular polysaccharide biosynthesis protein n=1 Tax=Georgenia daeguensis TaxID=908355 RepID=A0ABP6UMR2_9MICO
MDLFTILGATFRRWYVTLPVMLLAGILAYQAYQSVPSVYSSSVSVTVLAPVEPPPPPPDPVTGEIVEPYEANPYSGPNLAAAVLARNLNSASFEDGLGLDPDRNQTIEADPARDDPIIQIIATAESPATVNAILGEVTVKAATILDQFQAEAGATEGARYNLAPAVPTDAIEDVTPSRFRTAGAIVVIGFGVAAALATLLDMGLEHRRGARRRGAPEPGPAPAPGPGDEPATATAGPATAPAGHPAVASPAPRLSMTGRLTPGPGTSSDPVVARSHESSRAR